MIRRLLQFIRVKKGNPSSDHDNLMTLDEVAARLGVDVRVVRRAIAKGDIPALRIGKGFKIERSALECSLAIAAAHYGPAS
ncbi:hypothetical protein MTBLM1_90101 [Rhodospirillaceae bacterium LM-1]|nr:hypothetical protein MTBLM1_90101 [Rhodospirillaceae bacterium LM-1]